MSYNSKKRRQKALKQPRAVGGKFVSSSTDDNPISRIQQANQNLLSRLAGEPSSKNTPDDTLVNIKINNPFHKIIALLQDIKSKQSIPISLKFSIPLLALPVVLFFVFQIGRVQASCPTLITSKIGQLQTISVLVPEPPGLVTQIKLLLPQIPLLTNPNKLNREERALLIDASGSITHVIYPANMRLETFTSQRVLLTGSFSSCTGTMSLDTLENIRVY